MKKNINISMTNLIKTLILKKKNVGAFPIYENWDDIGNKETYKKLK
jgi:NDP-sugar pyrophosphorylase family protein